MSRPVKDVFEFCPSCGECANETGGNPFRCAECEFTFYFGPTVAVGAIVADASGKVLLIRRARDPGKGKFGMPGGFVDAGETGEKAVAREMLEEVRLTPTSTEYLATFPNTYDFQGIVTAVLDIFYVCKVEDFGSLRLEPTEVTGYEFSELGPDHLSNMAFESNRMALELYRERSAWSG